MGNCWCKKDNKSNNKKKKDTLENNKKQIQKDINKKQNLNNIIENQSNSKIIRKIGQIKGESIKISSNDKCLIIILDYSSSIHIQNCENCSFLLSPCSTSIQIRNCNNINVISASAQLRLTNINKGNFFIFTTSPMAIESCNNICLGNFFVQYTELPEMFHKSKLNIWDNKWSQYNEFGKNENIFYDNYNDENKNIVIDEFSDVFDECYINYDLYQFLPFTYGKSINLSDNLYKNILVVFRGEDFCEQELLKQITPIELEEKNIKFISSLVVQENKNNYDKIVEKIKNSSKNEELIDFFKNTNSNVAILSKNSGGLNITKCTQRGKGSFVGKLNEMDLTGTLGGDSNRRFLLRGDILLLWFISDNMDIDEFKQYMQFLYEPGLFGWITNEDIECEENNFQEYLSNLFFSQN